MSVNLSMCIPIAEIYISLFSNILFFMFVTPLTTVFQVAGCDPLVIHKIDLVGETSIFFKKWYIIGNFSEFNSKCKYYVKLGRKSVFSG